MRQLTDARMLLDMCSKPGFSATISPFPIRAAVDVRELNASLNGSRMRRDALAAAIFTTRFAHHKRWLLVPFVSQMARVAFAAEQSAADRDHLTDCTSSFEEHGGC